MREGVLYVKEELTTGKIGPTYGGQAKSIPRRWGLGSECDRFWGYMLNFTREHVLILGKTELLTFAWLILGGLDHFFGQLFFDTPELFLLW
jgi:hypothetical protein